MRSPFEFFDASTGAAEQSTTVEVLADLNRNGTEASLTRALADLDDLVADQSAEERSEGLPPELARLLGEIAGADDAPLAWASLHRRVQSGVTTWGSFWLDPTTEEDGMRLVFETATRSRLALSHGIATAREGRDTSRD